MTTQPNEGPCKLRHFGASNTRRCAPRHGGAFTFNALIPCPASAAGKPCVPGWINAARNQAELSEQKKEKIP